MNPASLVRKSAFEWWIPAQGRMRVPGVIYASEALIREMDEKVREQVSNVAMLPGIQRASYAMPDAHWGYGFPIGGVAAFDPEEGGVISAGGVGFDISCGVRTLRTGVVAADVEVLSGQAEQAYARLVALVRRVFGEDREAVRNHLVSLFTIASPDDPAVATARRALANALF